MGRKKILVAIDGSDYSHKVLDKAIEYAKLLDAEIVLVYCHKKFPVIIGQPHRDREIAAIIGETEKLMKPFLERFENENIAVAERFMEEPAGAIIPEVARIEKCDLIIMGSRGLTDLASLIVGSVTHRVLQTAPCSVLVVRE